MSNSHQRRMLSLTAIAIIVQHRTSSAFIPTAQKKSNVAFRKCLHRNKLHVKERERQEEHDVVAEDIDDDNTDDELLTTKTQRVDLISTTDENGDYFNTFENTEEEQDWLPDAKLVELATKIDERLTNRNVKTDKKYRPGETFQNGDDEDEEDPLARGYDPSPQAWDDPNELKKVIAGNGNQQTREEGYLGDSTLNEIASDYSIPPFYLADILCTWGVSPPIDMGEKLGDVILGEQAFSLLEALNSFDPSDLYDLYSRYDLRTFAGEYDLELKDVFEFAVKEGISLPFGVHSRLRKDQVEMLERYFDPDKFWEGDDDNSYDDDFPDPYF